MATTIMNAMSFIGVNVIRRFAPSHASTVKLPPARKMRAFSVKLVSQNTNPYLKINEIIFVRLATYSDWLDDCSRVIPRTPPTMSRPTQPYMRDSPVRASDIDAFPAIDPINIPTITTNITK